MNKEKLNSIKNKTNNKVLQDAIDKKLKDGHKRISK